MLPLFFFLKLFSQKGAYPQGSSSLVQFLHCRSWALLSSTVLRMSPLHCIRLRCFFVHNKIKEGFSWHATVWLHHLGSLTLIWFVRYSSITNAASVLSIPGQIIHDKSIDRRQDKSQPFPRKRGEQKRKHDLSRARWMHHSLYMNICCRLLGTKAACLPCACNNYLKNRSSTHHGFKMSLLMSLRRWAQKLPSPYFEKCYTVPDANVTRIYLVRPSI